MMRQSVATSLAISLLFVFTSAQAQAPTPGPEHEALGFWIGAWEIEARAHPNPLFPEGEYRATMTAEWYRSGFNVLCDYDWTGALGPYAELNVLGYDAGSGEYIVFGIDGFGGNSVFRGERQGDAWPYTMEMEVEGRPAAFRWTVTNQSPGVITWTSEISVEGGPWILAGEARATRK
jgi:hypothetical protein